MSEGGCLDRLGCSSWPRLRWWLELTYGTSTIKVSPLAARTITIAHFNDVYNVERNKKKPTGSAARFVAALRKFHAEATEPICFFSGDAFNPSIMSTVVKGAQMPLVLNAARVRCAVVGNHDFDHGPERLAELISMCSFPWLLSNVTRVGGSGYSPLVPGLQEFVVIHHGGRKLGLIGIVEEDWLETLFGVQRASIRYEDYVAAADRLSAKLRAPPHRCDAVLALTHMRQPNDDALAAGCPHLDAILAGHDHHYGITTVRGTTVFKSGTDFENFTSLDLTFDDASSDAAPAAASDAAPAAASTAAPATAAAMDRPATSSVRSRIANHTRHDIHADDFGDGDEAMARELAPFESQVEQMLGARLCDSAQALDCRRDCLRLMEAPLGNLVTDVMRAATAADVAFINAGTLRAERVLEPGALSMRELFEVLPMMENLSVIRVTGAVLLRALENSVSKLPKKDGRFAQVSGLSFVYDADKPPGARVDRRRVRVKGADLDVAAEYNLCSKEFICIDGKDGYDCFVGCPIVVDAEAHPALPTLLQRHLEALGKRGEPLVVGAEGRIREASDAAAEAEATAPSTAKPTPSPRKGRMQRMSKDLLGHDETPASVSRGTKMWQRLSKEVMVDPTIDTVSLVATAALPSHGAASKQAFGGAELEGAPAAGTVFESTFTPVVPMDGGEE